MLCTELEEKGGESAENHNKKTNGGQLKPLERRCNDPSVAH